MVLSCLSPAARMSSYTTSSPASTFHSYSFFFFNDPATTEIYTLSLHDALPILEHIQSQRAVLETASANHNVVACLAADRKSTRLNSSHRTISYAVFCLKKKTPAR